MPPRPNGPRRPALRGAGLRRAAFPVLTAAGCLLAILLLPDAALAAEAEGAPHLDGAAMGLGWVVPFAGILLSIALFPLVAPNFWHHNFGKISAFWAAAFLAPFAFSFGWELALYELLHTALLEYIPFIVLLLALFTVAGGVRVRGDIVGTPLANTAILGIGTVIASMMGTTGAAMLLIRPLLRANESRKHKVHVLVFFIFLVANIGGSLTPLGDPPLFLGFLQGVDFFWTTTHLFGEMLFLSVVLLALFYAMDTWYAKREPVPPAALPRRMEGERIGIEGWHNVALLGGVVGAVLLRGVWESGVDVVVFHVHVPLESVASNAALLAITGVSYAMTSEQARIRNAFSWLPILEVAKLFAGIFVTIVPALAILRAGEAGSLGFVLDAVTRPDGSPDPVMYFWLTGILSSFLDNAPTYLVFFNAAGGDPQHLMHGIPQVLAAISCGAVFMGANTYIGNAPNFMVKAIAEERGVAMPSFFGYMAWSGAILVPLFAAVTVLFFLR
jgi:Na+/H+ antiporter NhaD/arsenite permease-like protein